MKSVELINNLIKYIIENSKLPDYSEIDSITRYISYDMYSDTYDEDDLLDTMKNLFITLKSKNIPIFTNYKFHKMFSFISFYNKLSISNNSINTVFIELLNNELYTISQYIDDVSNTINKEYDKYSVVIPDYTEIYLYNMFPKVFRHISWEDITNRYVIMTYNDIYETSVEIFNILTELHSLASTLYNIFSHDIFRQISVDIINVILYDKEPILSIYKRL